MSFPRLARAAAAAAVAVAFTLGAAPATAQVASGSRLVISGTADATDIGTPGVLLAFDKRVLVATTGNTGAFASFNASNGKPKTAKLADVRVGYGPQNIRKFLEIGGYTFSLASLPSGPYGQDDCYVDPAVGQRCTPYQSEVGNPRPGIDGLSPFYLENTASGDPNAPFNSTAAFTLFGTVAGPGHATASFVGTIATSFAGLSYQEALYGLEQYGLDGINFTGTFVTGPATTASTTTIGVGATTLAPEPSTVALVAAGLVGAAGVTRRRRRAA